MRAHSTVPLYRRIRSRSHRTRYSTYSSTAGRYTCPRAPHLLRSAHRPLSHSYMYYHAYPYTIQASGRQPGSPRAIGSRWFVHAVCEPVHDPISMNARRIRVYRLVGMVAPTLGASAYTCIPSVDPGHRLCRDTYIPYTLHEGYTLDTPDPLNLGTSPPGEPSW